MSTLPGSETGVRVDVLVASSNMLSSVCPGDDGHGRTDGYAVENGSVGIISC